MEHLTVKANGAAFHVARSGAGPPLLLLHGWPEFWLTWEPVMARLADRFTLLAPDLRGFGDSDKPDGPFGPDQHAADMLALLDALGLRQVGVVGHDVGGALMQPLARKTPQRFSGLFFFDFVYPGIGARMAEPERLNNIWYQSFNQLEMAPHLVGATRESCRTYIGYFLKHWAHRKDAFDDVIEAFTDNFLKPGNIAGGFAHYRAAHEGRIRMMKGEAPPLAPIHVPSCVRWAPAVSVFLDRPVGRDLLRPRSRRVSGSGTLSASRGSRPRRCRNRRIFQTRRLELIGGNALQEWDRQTRQKPAVPCRVIEIVAGFTGQRERRLDGSDRCEIRNAISLLT
jgi:pimeloyl-ACP methyl ester carboxylesterase